MTNARNQKKNNLDDAILEDITDKNTDEMEILTQSPCIANQGDEIENLIARERKLPRTPLSNNSNEKTTNTPDDIRAYRHHTFALLNNNKQLNYLEFHKNSTGNTVPKGLLPDIKSGLRMTDTERAKWQVILQSCGRQLRNLLIQHHTTQMDTNKSKRDDLKRKITPDRLQQLNKEITHQYQENNEYKKRKLSMTPNKSETPQRSYQDRTPKDGRTPKN